MFISLQPNHKLEWTTTKITTPQIYDQPEITIQGTFFFMTRSSTENKELGRWSTDRNWWWLTCLKSLNSRRMINSSRNIFFALKGTLKGFIPRSSSPENSKLQWCIIEAIHKQRTTTKRPSLIFFVFRVIQ